MSRIKDSEADAHVVVAEKEPEAPYITKTKQELLMEKLRPYIEEEGRKLVRGRFRNYETPGASAPVIVSKYPGVEMFKKTLQDNEVYEIPLYVARFLNGTDIIAKGCDQKTHSCSYPIHGFRWEPGTAMPRSDQDAGGIPVPIIGVTKHNRRYGFESLEFDVAV